MNEANQAGFDLQRNEAILNRSIDIMLMEYVKLREESVSIANTQFTMLSLLVSVLGILSGIGINLFYENEKQGINNGSYAIAVIFVIIIPAASAFLSVLWLDRVYRHKQLCTYLAGREKIINRCLSLGKVKINALNWENWLVRESAGKGFFEKTNHFYYYISIGSLCLIPLVSMGIGWGLGNLNFKDFWVKIFFAFGIFVYLVFFSFLIVYIIRILKENNVVKKKPSS